MTNYIIGITPRINQTENATYIRVHRDYINSLTKIGLNPIIICPETNLELILPLCDAFLVIGGDDYNPTMYHQTNDDNLSTEINDEIDKIDQNIINYAIKVKKPIMGICRGHQAMSAIFGYELYQDIEKANLQHPHKEKLHEVTKVNNFGFAKELPDHFITNTFHHQATKTLPDGFIVLFKNQDVIEALEHEYLPIITTQWHPERMNTEESKIIFLYFRSLIEKYHKNQE